jgi:hypothetical protein
VTIRRTYGPAHTTGPFGLTVVSPAGSARREACAEEEFVSGPRSAPAPGVHVEREAVTAAELEEAGVDLSAFPDSTEADFKRYPVLTEGGWYIVIKHQPTLSTVSKKKWDLLGPVKLVSHGLHLA